MDFNIIYFKVSGSVLVFPEKYEFNESTTFPHYVNWNGLDYKLKKHIYKEKHYLIGYSAPIDDNEIDSAIEEFKPIPLY